MSVFLKTKALQNSRAIFSLKNCFFERRFVSRFAYPAGMVAYEDDFVDEIKYPRVDYEKRDLPEKYHAALKRYTDIFDKIRNAQTIEEKQMEFNMPRKYGWKSLQIREEFFDYDSLEFYKYITRTHFVNDGSLPAIFSSPSPEMTEKINHFVKILKDPLLDILKFEMSFDHPITYDLGVNDIEKDKATTNSVVNQINRLILSTLSHEIEHLKTCQVDYDTNIEAFWFAGGMERSQVEKTKLGNIKGRLKERQVIRPEDPCDNIFQYIAKPIIQVRCEHPISNFVKKNDRLCAKGEEMKDRFPYYPNVYGITRDYRYATLVPGYRPEDSFKGSHLTYHSCDFLMHEPIQRSPEWQSDTYNMITSQAIIASFSKLLAQALYYGFDQFSGLKYPFSTQTVVTNGSDWTFYSYQLNTTNFHQYNILKNKKQNICWGTRTMKIIQENKESKEIEINEECLKNLIMFYLNEPAPIKEKNPCPHLKKELKDIEDEIYREKIHHNQKVVYSQRRLALDAFPIPEIYDWERIYKIRHKTMPMEARRRFFEIPDSQPYYEPLTLEDPRNIGKGLKLKLELLKKRQEEEEMDAMRKSGSIPNDDDYSPDYYPEFDQKNPKDK